METQPWEHRCEGIACLYDAIKSLSAIDGSVEQAICRELIHTMDRLRFANQQEQPTSQSRKPAA